MIKKKIYHHVVPLDYLGKVRLREYLKGLFPYLETGSAVKKAIQKNQILLNGKVGFTGDWVYGGCKISFEWSYNVDDQSNFNIRVYYEDDYLIVVAKPPGLSSSGNTMSLQLQLQSISLSDDDGILPFPFLVHRLDKATEGLMIAAKSIVVRRLLSAMIESHAIVKNYVLIVEGHLAITDKFIKTEIDGNVAVTEIIESVPLHTKDPTSKVFVRLHTGKTHQIRRHFSEMNHPIVGDQIYNKGGLTFGTGLLLCAHFLEFIHPVTQSKIKIEYPIPYKIDKYALLYSS